LSTAGVDLQTIESRMSIRYLVQKGNMDKAIEAVNELNPEVGSCLFFSFSVY
jgi:hypothetical protein